MNNKTTKNLLNGMLLAAVATVGVMAYQLVSSPLEEENLPDEVQVEMSRVEKREPEPPIHANANNVEIELQRKEQDKIREVSAKKEKTKKDNTENKNKDVPEVEETISNFAEEMNEESEQEVEAEETAVTNVDAWIPPAAYMEFTENTAMEWPVHGNILLDYDMDQTTYFPTLDQYRLNPAISVRAVEGTPVTAAVDGAVYEINEDPRTGTTVTMELGNGYQAIYGQLKDLNVYEGQVVSRGDTIGYIDAPTKYYSEEGSNLYFAMKKNGEPLDPILYLP